MRGEPHSYQSIAAWMKDEPDYLDGRCDQCSDQAIEQAQYDEMLCEQHYRDAVLWDAADEMNQAGWEEGYT